MKPIIKETLAQKQGKDKILYFLYAYKEIIIGGLIALAAIGLFMGSLLSRQDTIFRGKVLTEQGTDNWLAEDLSKTYTDLLQPGEKERVLVDAANLDDSQTAEVIGTQLAAKEIDIIWVNETLVDEFVERYDQDNLTESDLTYTKNDTTFVARIIPNAPHQQALKKVSALYE